MVRSEIGTELQDPDLRKFGLYNALTHIQPCLMRVEGDVMVWMNGGFEAGEGESMTNVGNEFYLNQSCGDCIEDHPIYRLFDLEN